VEIGGTHTGISVSGTSEMVDITTAKIRGVEGNGINVSSTPSVITTDGTTIDTSDIGLYIGFSARTRRLTVSGTTIRNMRSTGIVIKIVFDNIIVSGTTIENTGGRGVQVFPVSYTNVDRNVNLEIIDSIIKNTTVNGNGAGLLFTQSANNSSFWVNFVISGTSFINNTA